MPGTLHECIPGCRHQPGKPTPAAAVLADKKSQWGEEKPRAIYCLYTLTQTCMCSILGAEKRQSPPLWEWLQRMVQRSGLRIKTRVCPTFKNKSRNQRNLSTNERLRLLFFLSTGGYMLDTGPAHTLSPPGRPHQAGGVHRQGVAGHAKSHLWQLEMNGI